MFENDLETITLLAGLVGGSYWFSNLFLPHRPIEARSTALPAPDPASTSRS